MLADEAGELVWPGRFERVGQRFSPFLLE